MLAFTVSMSVVGSSGKFESRLDAPTLGASCAGKWAPFGQPGAGQRLRLNTLRRHPLR